MPPRIKKECVKLFWDVEMGALSPWKHADPSPLPGSCHSRAAKLRVPCHQGCYAILRLYSR